MHGDLVGRDFTADGPNQLRLYDITEHTTCEWASLTSAQSKDVFSNRAVGSSTDSRMITSLTTTQALHSA